MIADTGTADAGIVQRLRRRDPLALSETYDRYGGLTYSLILRMVRDGAIAQDLVQETFLRVWTGVTGFDTEKGALRPWLLSIAHNCAIDYLRSNWRERNSLGRRELDYPSFYGYTERDILASENARAIRTALHTLLPRHREVIELAYFEGLTQTEMAKRLEQRLGTVKTRVRTALKKLRDEFDRAVSGRTSEGNQGRNGCLPSRIADEPYNGDSPAMGSPGHSLGAFGREPFPLRNES
jgi:RNA polymerase sigma-70 factor (ECF subfamily)